MVAAARALESARENRLIDDPYAAALATAAGPAVPTAESDISAGLPDAVDYIGVRSRFFDNWFEKVCADGVRQAVILASGLDTRAFRLPWPDELRLFEIDQPKVLAYKDEVLDQQGARLRCVRQLVAVDLRDDWATALRQAGFDPTRPTAWLAEGLLYYLSATAEQQLLRTIHDLSAAGSRIAIENLHTKRSTLLNPDMSESSQRWGVDLDELLSAEDRTNAADLLTESGWLVHRETAIDAAGRFGRELGGAARGLSQFGDLLTAELPH
ncbi:SAM-dependent methyltransferase [Saccharopolyspora soli]|uniref:SAM-dependent methyltransferase n=1 Tax=Saccharopolyspora soli TaxID=2926618 RepID=UPI002413ADAD|nr:SAM-dependent methyltransferase [Saccharopolyspora soli]